MSKVMQEGLRALRAREITFERFHRDTAEDWRKLAASLLGRWSVPAGIELEDVRQEMLLAAWRAVHDPDAKRRWDPSRGVTLQGFVVWSACNAAAKWLHTQRRALRRSGNAPSRHALTLQAMRIDPDGELSPAEAFDLLASVDPTQEEEVDQVQRFRAIQRTAPTAFAADAFRRWLEAGGDLAGAALDAWLDPATRADHGWRSPGQAARVMGDAVHGMMSAAAGPSKELA
jgi:DNA-directed RNA polymerase specialized sigma24 family protein